MATYNPYPDKYTSDIKIDKLIKEIQKMIASKDINFKLDKSTKTLKLDLNDLKSKYPLSDSSNSDIKERLGNYDDSNDDKKYLDLLDSLALDNGNTKLTSNEIYHLIINPQFLVDLFTKLSFKKNLLEKNINVSKVPLYFFESFNSWCSRDLDSKILIGDTDRLLRGGNLIDDPNMYSKFVEFLYDILNKLTNNEITYENATNMINKKYTPIPITDSKTKALEKSNFIDRIQDLLESTFKVIDSSTVSVFHDKNEDKVNYVLMCIILFNLVENYPQKKVPTKVELQKLRPSWADANRSAKAYSRFVTIHTTITKYLEESRRTPRLYGMSTEYDILSPKEMKNFFITDLLDTTNMRTIPDTNIINSFKELITVFNNISDFIFEFESLVSTLWNDIPKIVEYYMYRSNFLNTKYIKEDENYSAFVKKINNLDDRNEAIQKFFITEFIENRNLIAHKLQIIKDNYTSYTENKLLKDNKANIAIYNEYVNETDTDKLYELFFVDKNKGDIFVDKNKGDIDETNGEGYDEGDYAENEGDVKDGEKSKTAGGITPGSSDNDNEDDDPESFINNTDPKINLFHKNFVDPFDHYFKENVPNLIPFFENVSKFKLGKRTCLFYELASENNIVDNNKIHESCSNQKTYDPEKVLVIPDNNLIELDFIPYIDMKVFEKREDILNSKTDNTEFYNELRSVNSCIEKLIQNVILWAENLTNILRDDKKVIDQIMEFDSELVQYMLPDSKKNYVERNDTSVQQIRIQQIRRQIIKHILNIFEKHKFYDSSLFYFIWESFESSTEDEQLKEDILTLCHRLIVSFNMKKIENILLEFKDEFNIKLIRLLIVMHDLYYIDHSNVINKSFDFLKKYVYNLDLSVNSSLKNDKSFEIKLDNMFGKRFYKKIRDYSHNNKVTNDSRPMNDDNIVRNDDTPRNNDIIYGGNTIEKVKLNINNRFLKELSHIFATCIKEKKYTKHGTTHSFCKKNFIDIAKKSRTLIPTFVYLLESFNSSLIYLNTYLDFTDKNNKPKYTEFKANVPKYYSPKFEKYKNFLNFCNTINNLKNTPFDLSFSNLHHFPSDFKHYTDPITFLEYARNYPIQNGGDPPKQPSLHNHLQKLISYQEQLIKNLGYTCSTTDKNRLLKQLESFKKMEESFSENYKNYLDKEKYIRDTNGYINVNNLDTDSYNKLKKDSEALDQQFIQINLKSGKIISNLHTMNVKLNNLIGGTFI